MSNNNDDDVEKFVDALDKTLDERLPDGEIATKNDVEDMVDERLKAQEDSPKEGTPERPSGDGDGGTQTDPDYDGDNPDNTSSDSDKVEEKSNSYTEEELKSILPDDQFKAIEPLLEREDDMMDDEPDVDPMDERPEEVVEPEPAEEPVDDVPELGDEEDEEVMAAKAVDNLDWDRLSEGQKKALAKSGSVRKSQGNVRASSGVGGGQRPSHASQQSDADEVAKAEGDAVNADPALRKVYDDDGQPQI